MPMDNFNFQNPTRIVFGKGQIKEITNYIPKDKIVIMTCGGGSIKKNGVYEQVMKALDGYTVKEFWGIEANPDYETLLKCVALVTEQGPKNCYMLSVGGGSVLDGTKFIAAASLYTHSDNLWEILETYGAFVTEAIPIVDVMTLAATGSEMNWSSVVSWRNKHLKLFFQNECVYPKVSILDPETMYSLPTRQTSNGIVDAMVHVLEQYITYPQGADVNDRYAEALLKTLIDNGTKVMTNPEDYEARANVMWAATQALNGIIAAGVATDWATHMIGQEITANIGMDHGQTLACVEPVVFHYKFEQKKEKLAQMAERVFNITEGTVEEKAEAGIQALINFYENVVHVPTHISAYPYYNQDKAWIQDVKARFTKNGLVFGEHHDITPEDVEKILLSCY
ncbi:hypothetical protein WA158_007365 [Blastocystis sp. Blastoise]